MATTPGSIRSVVVTGVAQPGQLGDIVARAFAACGDRVSIVARSIDDAAARVREMRADGLHGTPFACDLADPQATMTLANQVLAVEKRVDILVNVAGGFAMSGPVADSDPVVLAQQLTINLGTAYATTRAFLPGLREARGSVVFIASAAALPAARVKNTSAYAVAKGAVITLMRAIAQEELVHGVRANAVAPGTIRTRQNSSTLPADTRFVEPASVASTILFLCSADAAQVTGQVIELTP